jgi:hypothetical protein
MAFRNWFGPVIAGGLAAVVVGGCSSSPAPKAKNEAGASGNTMLDGSVAGDDSGVIGFDGTTGQACTTDADCAGATGPGINKCSIDYDSQFQIANVFVDLWATPVCIMPPDTSVCDPDPQSAGDGYPHFCDGPDDPSSPGICIPDDANDPHTGFCYPQCTFAIDGSKPVGCAGTDACNPSTFLRSATTQAVTGFGFCAGGCQVDTDCAPLGAGFVCQADIGYCTKNKVQRSKAVGTTCQETVAVDDYASGACYCDADPTTGQGFCSTACIVGGVPCANGWVCDAGYQSPLTFVSQDGTMVDVPITAQNVGVPGVCRPACALPTAGVVADAGAPPEAGTADATDAMVDAMAEASTPTDAMAEASTTGDDGGVSDAAIAVDATPAVVTCPPNSTCQALNLAGPDCVP